MGGVKCLHGVFGPVVAFRKNQSIAVLHGGVRSPVKLEFREFLSCAERKREEVAVVGAVHAAAVNVADGVDGPFLQVGAVRKAVVGALRAGGKERAGKKKEFSYGRVAKREVFRRNRTAGKR